LSGGGNPFYKVAQFDSRNLLQLGKALGIKPLEQEASYNVKNPGHAISTAAEYALGGYLGSLLGGGEAAGAAAPAVDESAGLAMNAGGAAGTTAGQLASQQAAQQALAQAAPQGLANTMEAGLTDTGYTPSSLWNALSNPGASSVSAANRALGTSASQTGLLGNLTSGGSTGKGGMLAQQMALKLMQPQGQPQQPMGHPSQGGSMAPLANPYGTPQQGPYGTPAGNSIGFTEEQKKKLRAMGYQI
jgi:hypothetical protein